MSHKRKGQDGFTDPFTEIRGGVDGLLSALGSVVSEISDRLESGEEREVHRSFEVDTGKGPVRAEASFRMRFAESANEGRQRKTRSVTEPVDVPSATATKRSGNSPKGRPLDFEVVEDGGTWTLSADIPGVERSDLRLSEADGNLVIETIGNRRYRAVCPLPKGVGVATLHVILRNGILELSSKGGINS